MLDARASEVTPVAWVILPLFGKLGALGIAAFLVPRRDGPEGDEWSPITGARQPETDFGISTDSKDGGTTDGRRDTRNRS